MEGGKKEKERRTREGKKCNGKREGLEGRRERRMEGGKGSLEKGKYSVSGE